MRKLDFYEFVGIVVPGTILLAGVALCVPSVKRVVFEGDLTVGETALSVVVAYGLGHLVQGVGNLLEKTWWWLWGGMPSDWPRTGKHNLIAALQVDRINDVLEKRLGLTLEGGFKSLSKRDWFGIVRQIYAGVSKAGDAKRVDIFNGNYGLNRGIAASLVTIFVTVLITQGSAGWRYALLLGLGFFVAVYRMHRFGVHYGRELFVQLLIVPAEDKQAAAKKED